jgi:hypothetical protein
MELLTRGVRQNAKDALITCAGVCILPKTHLANQVKTCMSVPSRRITTETPVGAPSGTIEVTIGGLREREGESERESEREREREREVERERERERRGRGRDHPRTHL